MNNFIKHLKQASIVDKFIYINLGVFILVYIVNTFTHLNNGANNFVINFLALSKEPKQFLYKPYTFITYGFLHVNFIHILFNLIALYYLGNLFTNFFTSKRFVTYYILGSLFGGLLFVISFNYFPIFKNSSGILLGASAGISALLIGLATKVPNYEIKIRFIGFVKIWILALVYILLSIILIPNGNAGGQFAHLGGAFIGFLLTTYFEKNKHPKKNKSNLKTVYKSKNKSEDFGLSVHQKKILKQRKIDTILDKISKSGYDSLTQTERDFLANISKEN